MADFGGNPYGYGAGPAAGLNALLQGVQGYFGARGAREDRDQAQRDHAAELKARLDELQLRKDQESRAVSADATQAQQWQEGQLNQALGQLGSEGRTAIIKSMQAEGITHPTMNDFNKHFAIVAGGTPAVTQPNPQGLIQGFGLDAARPAQMPFASTPPWQMNPNQAGPAADYQPTSGLPADLAKYLPGAGTVSDIQTAQDILKPAVPGVDMMNPADRAVLTQEGLMKRNTTTTEAAAAKQDNMLTAQARRERGQLLLGWAKKDTMDALNANPAVYGGFMLGQLNDYNKVLGLPEATVDSLKLELGPLMLSQVTNTNTRTADIPLARRQAGEKITLSRHFLNEKIRQNDAAYRLKAKGIEIQGGRLTEAHRHNIETEAVALDRAGTYKKGYTGGGKAKGGYKLSGPTADTAIGLGFDTAAVARHPDSVMRTITDPKFWEVDSDGKKTKFNAAGIAMRDQISENSRRELSKPAPAKKPGGASSEMQSMDRKNDPRAQALARHLSQASPKDQQRINTLLNNWGSISEKDKSHFAGLAGWKQ